MSNFTDQRPLATYPAILSLESNLISSSLKEVQDSKGNATALSLSIDVVRSEGKVEVGVADTSTTDTYAVVRDQTTGELRQRLLGNSAFSSTSMVPQSTTIRILGTENEVEVDPSGEQDLSTDRVITIGLPDDVTIGNDLTVTNDIYYDNADVGTTELDVLLVGPGGKIVKRTLNVSAFLDSVYTAGTGIDITSNVVSLSHLGLESLVDPNDNRIYYWDDTAGASAWLDIGTGLQIVGGVLESTASGAGEANTMTNLGAGEGVYYQKTGVQFEMKSLTVTGLSISSSTSEIDISLTAGEGMVVSAGVASFKNNAALTDSTIMGWDDTGTQLENTPLTYSGSDVTSAGALIATTNLSVINGIYTASWTADTLAANVAFEIPGSYAGSNGQVMTFNTDGTFNSWGALGETNTMSNLGAGEGVYYQKTGVDFELKSLKVSGSLGISSTTSEITITGTDTTYTAGTGLDLTGSVFSLQHLGLESLTAPAGDRIYFYDQSAGTSAWLEIGTGLTITGTTLSNTGGATGEVNTASNLGAGEGVYATKVGADLQFKSLVGGNAISLSSTSTEITIDAAYNAGTGIGIATDTISLSHLGLESLTNPGADRIYFWDNTAGSSEWLTVSNGLLLSGTSLTANITAANLGTGAEVLNDTASSGYQKYFRTLTSSDGSVTITEGTNSIDFTGAGGGYTASGGIDLTASNFTLDNYLNFTNDTILLWNDVSGYMEDSALYQNTAGTRLETDYTFRTTGVYLKGTTNSVGLLPTAATAAYNLTFPAAQGSATQILYNNGAGQLVWAANVFTASSLGSTGETVYQSTVGGDAQFNRIKAGTDISVSKAAGEITISYTGSGGTTYTGAGGVNITGSVVSLENYVNFSNNTILYWSAAGQLEDSALSFAGADYTLASANLEVEGDIYANYLVATNPEIGFTNGTYQHRFAPPSGASSSAKWALPAAQGGAGNFLYQSSIGTLAWANVQGSNVGTGSDVYKSSPSAGTLEFRTIIGGTNVTVVQNANDLTISATSYTGTGGVNITGSVVSLENNASFSDGYVLIWDDVNSQLINSDIHQSGGFIYADLDFVVTGSVFSDTAFTLNEYANLISIAAPSGGPSATYTLFMPADGPGSSQLLSVSSSSSEFIDAGDGLTITGGALNVTTDGGIAILGSDVELKNNPNFTDDTILFWDASNGQLSDSKFHEQFTTWGVGLRAVSDDLGVKSLLLHDVVSGSAKSLTLSTASTPTDSYSISFPGVDVPGTDKYIMQTGGTAGNAVLEWSNSFPSICDNFSASSISDNLNKVASVAGSYGNVTISSSPVTVTTSRTAKYVVVVSASAKATSVTGNPDVFIGISTSSGGSPTAGMIQNISFSSSDGATSKQSLSMATLWPSTLTAGTTLYLVAKNVATGTDQVQLEYINVNLIEVAT
jgi:hypothetical protein